MWKLVSTPVTCQLLPLPRCLHSVLIVSISQQEDNMLPITPNQPTKEPLVEEFGVAAQIWKLSSCDL